MENLLIIASLARIIPYGITAYIGFKRRYKWLCAATTGAILIVALVSILHLPEYVRAILGSFTAFATMMHALVLNKLDKGVR